MMKGFNSFEVFMEKTMKSIRPPLLSVLCIAGFLGCFLKMILVISPPVQDVGSWYALYLTFSTVYLVVCLVGLWSMRRWAPWAFFLYEMGDQFVYWKIGVWSRGPSDFGHLLIPQVLPLAILAVAFLYYRRME
jgi:hypothetical protein